MMGWRAVKRLWHHHGTEGSVHQCSRSVWLIIKVIYLMTVVQNDLAWWRFCVSIWGNAFAPAANALECESTLSDGHIAKLLLLTHTGDFGGRRSAVQLHRYVRPTWAALLGGWGEAQNLAVFLVFVGGVLQSEALLTLPSAFGGISTVTLKAVEA